MRKKSLVTFVVVLLSTTLLFMFNFSGSAWAKTFKLTVGGGGPCDRVGLHARNCTGPLRGPVQRCCPSSCGPTGHSAPRSRPCSCGRWFLCTCLHDRTLTMDYARNHRISCVPIRFSPALHAQNLLPLLNDLCVH